MARAGQVMLSSPGKGIRPRVTLKPACVMAEFTDPARPRLRVIHGAWAVFRAVKREGWARASDEAKRWIPLPLSLAWRLRQAAALAWLASSARLLRSTEV